MPIVKKVVNISNIHQAQLVLESGEVVYLLPRQEVKNVNIKKKQRDKFLKAVR